MYESIAVVGATGAVGRIILDQIESRKLPFRKLTLLASARSTGKKIQVGSQEYTVQPLVPEAFEDIDLAICSTPDDIAKWLVPEALKRNCTVIDESGAWRMDDRAALVVPEVNPEALKNHQGLIASPNCSTTQMVVALKPLHDAARVKRVIVSTYQAASGAGLGGSRELEECTQAVLQKKEFTPEVFSHQLAFNAIPQIGSHKEQGYTSEEMKMVYETQKIFGDKSIRVSPTCVRIPVTNCHSETILVETERKLSVEEARKCFEEFPGIRVIDDLDQKLYPLPNECTGQDEVFIGRIREDLSCGNGLNFWCVSDNLRKGAATNAVQIAEALLKETPVSS
ncbi:Aspartate-semialdehyde dehydrogenase [Planctomycetales bacterium 10988]|nr:Aspartate-semialdehyde dehydrogenase [Planctomycetales bacterium 10988]